MKKYTKIMGTFSKTANKLEALAESNAKKAEIINSNIAVLQGESDELAGEATQAVFMAEKLKSFLEV